MKKIIVVEDEINNAIRDSIKEEAIFIGIDTDNQRIKTLIETETLEFFIAINDIQTRESQCKRLQSFGGKNISIIDETAVLANTATIESGVYIGKKVVLSVGCNIGEGSFIYGATTIDYDVTVGKYCNIETAAVIGSKATIGEKSYIRIGAVIDKNCAIQDGTEIPAGYGINYIE